MYVCMYVGIFLMLVCTKLGLSPPDSVAAGLEHLLFPIGERQFGDFGTLAAVSAVTAGLYFMTFDTVRPETYCNY